MSTFLFSYHFYVTIDDFPLCASLTSYLLTFRRCDTLYDFDLLLDLCSLKILI